MRAYSIYVTHTFIYVDAIRYSVTALVNLQCSQKYSIFWYVSKGIYIFFPMFQEWLNKNCRFFINVEKCLEHSNQLFIASCLLQRRYHLEIVSCHSVWLKWSNVSWLWYCVYKWRKLSQIAWKNRIINELSFGSQLISHFKPGN